MYELVTPLALPQYADAIVIRHSDPRVFDELDGCNVPLLNAGNGAEEHPTQGLLDLLCMKTEVRDSTHPAKPPRAIRCTETLTASISFDLGTNPTACTCGQLGSLDNLVVTLVGDLKHGRTVHSLSTLLSRFDNVTLNLVAPESLRMPSEWLEPLKNSGMKVTTQSP